MKAKVGISKCTNYGIINLTNAILDAIDSVDFPDVIGKKILLKPNILSDAKVEDCITTNPEFVRVVIRILKARGSSLIYVGDSPGLVTSTFRGEKCGIYQVCQDEGAVWVNFSENPNIYNIDGTNQKLPLCHILKEVDMVFSLCKMKTHQLMYTTGAVKNLFGTVPGLNKSPCHLKNPTRESFAKLIVGIHQTVKPAFSIMDGVVAMEGPGPANGNPRPVNLILASDNAFALDTAQAIIMGYNVSDIPILNEAKRRKIYPDEIEYTLLDPNKLVITDFKRVAVSRKTRFIKSLVLPYFTRSIQKKKQKKETAPSFNTEKCIKCLRCVNICPAHALMFDKNESKLVFDSSKCIRCYCCHEMCPQNAISVEKTGDTK